MPQSLSGRTTLLLVAIAFGLTLAVQLLLSGQPSATAPAARRSAPSVVADAPAAKPDLRLVAAGTVPALREPRKRRPPAREPKRSVRKVTQPAPSSGRHRAARGDGAASADRHAALHPTHSPAQRAEAEAEARPDLRAPARGRVRHLR